MSKMKRIITFGILLSMISMIYKGQGVKAEKFFSVKYNLTGVTVSPKETSIDEGSSMSMVFKAKKGYNLPQTVKVSMNGATLSNGYTYENGVLNIDEVYGDTVITAVGSVKKSSYKVSFDLYKVSASRGAGNVKEGSSYSVKLTPAAGYSLKKSNVSVVVDGVTQVDGYTYADETLTIDKIKGRTLIEAMAVKKSKSQKETTDSSSASKTDNKKSSKGSNKKNDVKQSNAGTSGSNSYKSGSGVSTSKSVQDLKKSGKTPVNYNQGSYRAPKTGEDFDIRYLGAVGLILVGAGVVILNIRKKQKLQISD